MVEDGEGLRKAFAVGDVLDAEAFHVFRIVDLESRVRLE
ncbi:hypothetical protein HPL003_18350 [Paenibacillus terrae HPL-003]|uniref:Uncharacterized protein n=1 Tax=Paenibacillus terrae (strain HPL-003) TaxID=985665 RepID=G7W2R7_PAETH|nr:hypothetical protein HPL003_18350 [Paenibacillus terrae HPL-003]